MAEKNRVLKYLKTKTKWQLANESAGGDVG